MNGRICNLESGIRDRGDSRAGFTILEVLMAIGILALSITAVLFLFAMGMRSHKRALDRTRAAMLAETVVNKLQADLKVYGNPTDPRDPTVAPPDKATHPDFPGFHYSVRFSQLPNASSYYRASILVFWGEPPKPDEPLDPRNSETYETVLQRKSF